MRLPRRLKTIAVAVGIACLILMVWRYWSFSGITMDEDYEIKIGQEELEQLRRGRDLELDYDLEKIIKQKLRDAEQGRLKDVELPEFVQPTGSLSQIKLWHSPLFEQVLGTSVFFRSPTFDNRDKSQEIIRILFTASNQNHSAIYCHIMTSHDPNHSLHLVTQARLDVAVVEENGVIQGEVMCPWTSATGPVVTTLSTSNSNITNHWHDIEYYTFRPPRQLRYNVCLSAKSLVNADADSVMHWFDLQKLLGVTNVSLYGLPNLSPADMDLLDQYKDTNLLHVIYWQMPFETMDNGQYLANLDCLYKNMAASTFLIFLDICQYLVPGQSKTLHEMLQYIDDNMPRAATYTFQINRYKSHLEKIIFDGSSLNIQQTFKAQGDDDNLNRNVRKSSKPVAIRPQFVKNVKGLFSNNKESNVETEVVGNGIGQIVQYGSSSACD